MDNTEKLGFNFTSTPILVNEHPGTGIELIQNDGFQTQTVASIDTTNGDTTNGDKWFMTFSNQEPDPEPEPVQSIQCLFPDKINIVTGVNGKYIFNDKPYLQNDFIGVNIGKYALQIPPSHPIGFLINDTSKFQKFT